MAIIKVKQVICDWCGCAIDYLDASLSDSEIKKIIKLNGAIVTKNGIYCCKQCKNGVKE